MVCLLNKIKELKMKCEYLKLNAAAVGLSMGLIYAIAIFVMGLMATYFDHGHDIVELMGTFYPGYDVGLVPSLIGALWGFLDGVILGFLWGVFYNMFNKCCCSMSGCMSKSCKSKKKSKK
jgi:hypothetical protein